MSLFKSCSEPESLLHSLHLRSNTYYMRFRFFNSPVISKTALRVCNYLLTFPVIVVCVLLHKAVVKLEIAYPLKKYLDYVITTLTNRFYLLLLKAHISNQIN